MLNKVYRELGETPLHIDIKCKMVLFWARLITSKENTLSQMIYSLLYKLYEKDLFHSSWISSVINILDSAGFSGIWTKQSQYCGEPPWPRGSVLGLRPPGLEFRILCLEDTQSSHHPQAVILAQFSLSVHKSGLKPDSFHLFWTKQTIQNHNSQVQFARQIHTKLEWRHNTRW